MGLGRFNILSLSGGGARGLYTARALVEIEERFGRPIAESVDILCGTSIGGVLALGLASEVPAADILKVFDKNRLKIFPAPNKKESLTIPFTPFTIRDVQQARRAQFSAEPLKEVLTQLFGDLTIGDLKHCVLIPAINYTTGTLRAFKTPHHPDFYQDSNKSLVDVAMATSAAPTYFPNHVINDARFVDGGLVVNNPVLMGVIEAQRAFSQDMNNIHALCIGNMGKERAANHEKPLNLGYKGWGFGRDIIDLSMSVGEKLSFDMARLLLNGRISEMDTKPTDDQAHLMKLDNATDEAASILKAQAEQMAGQKVNDEKIKDFFAHTKTTSPSCPNTKEE
ncbi:MAG: CBASS cGAMP-activated phospholipase [Pseudomonadota bacterium]